MLTNQFVTKNGRHLKCFVIVHVYALEKIDRCVIDLVNCVYGAHDGPKQPCHSLSFNHQIIFEDRYDSARLGSSNIAIILNGEASRHRTYRTM